MYSVVVGEVVGRGRVVVVEEVVVEMLSGVVDWERDNVEDCKINRISMLLEK